MKTKILILIFISLFTFHISHFFSQSVQQQWVARYDSPYHLDDVPVGLAVDKWGNSYVTGYSYINGSKRVITTLKYNSSGVQQWAKVFNDTTWI